LDSLEKQFNETVDRNREEESRLRREKKKAESALIAKISQYDEDMETRKTNLAELQRSFQEESAEYATLKEYFDKIDSNLAYESSENKILDAVNRRELFAKKYMDKAATLIQKIARGRIHRAEVAKLKSKKGGKKAGKKAKK
jgi:predicted RNase H-like nuclease (RuvC/YqgF family)